MQNSYTVINASAGSGKTYSLVQRLLTLCLRYPNQPDAIRHILALTFTNKAANEMKERILRFLGEFVQNDYQNNPHLIGIQAALEKDGIRVNLEDLRERAQKVLDYILHHYSTLNIGTIDKFNARLVKSFSYELGLAQNFNLDIQAEPYLIEAVDKMLDEIGDNQQVSATFMDYITYNLDNHQRVNLNQTLYKSAKTFVSDIHYKSLKENQNFEWDAYEKKKTELREKIRTCKIQAADIAKKALALIQSNGLQIEDFAQGKNGIGGFFQAALEHYNNPKKKAFPIPSTTEEAKMESFQKGASAKGKGKEDIIFDILPQLIDYRRQIFALHIEERKKEIVLDAILPLKVNADIQKKLAEIEEENDLVLLSKFNILINENLRNEPSAFIYEKVGTQYQHYFFDEFQDTSTLQWENFIPLRDNSVTSENTSFTLVGDPKQSIYRFRGGDSQLMLDIINKKEITPRYAETELLKYNWRSAKNIVDFNNRLYDFMSQHLHAEHQEIFGKNAQQEAKSSLDGRVRINLIEYANKDIFFEDVANKMQEDIQQCLDNGFSFSDITILCRGNTDIFYYSQLLGNLEVQYQGRPTYIKTISEKGLTLDLSFTIQALIEFLKWETVPNNRQYLVRMMYYLDHSGRISLTDFTKELRTILSFDTKKEIIDYLQSHYHIQLSRKNLPQLNLYNHIEFYLREFSVPNREVDFLLNFLEMLYNFTQNAGATLKEFLKYWDEEAHQISIQASENVDAIQIMTIHKAKGLEFPVVLLPMKNENKDYKFSDWYDLKSSDELKKIMIEAFPSNLENYDADLASFNQENIYQNKIDRYCIQYVATTRPVEQLFLYIEKPNKSANHLEIYDYIKAFQPEIEGTKIDAFDLYEVTADILKKHHHKEQKSFKSQHIQALKHPKVSKSIIKIATPSKSYQNRVNHVRTGIFTHEILAKINAKSDAEKILRSYWLEGVITEDEKTIILDKIQSIMNDERYSSYFDKGLEVINEREMLALENNQSKVYRPDRLIKTTDGFVIIDFKTGEPKDQDLKQIEGYKQLLEKFGEKVIKTDIIYIP